VSLRPVLALLLALALGLLAAGPASAATFFPRVAVRANTAGGAFTGTLALDHFESQATGLVAIGSLSGTLKDRRYPAPQKLRFGTFTFPAVVGPIPGSTDCARLGIGLQARTVRLFGLRATFPARGLTLRPRSASPRAYRPLLCGISQAIAAKLALPIQAQLLTGLVQSFPTPSSTSRTRT
jgi:hypothetical protein